MKREEALKQAKENVKRNVINKGLKATIILGLIAGAVILISTRVYGMTMEELAVSVLTMIPIACIIAILTMIVWAILDDELGRAVDREYDRIRSGTGK